MRSKLFNMFVLSALMLSLMGCASFGRQLKAFLRGGDAPPVQQKSAAISPMSSRKFSQDPNYMMGPRRQYQHMTKKKLETESRLEDNAGSLWVMEGQGAYLFSQNIMRMIGDPLPVKIEGEPKEQLSSKARIITELLDRIQARRLAASRRLASVEKKSSAKTKSPDKTQKKSSQTTAANQESSSSSSDFNVKTVPTRIVERTVDGNYRVKGSQAFMLGSREYKVIVTGIVRAQDFSEEGVSARQLLDSKFDIVSKRRKE